MYCKPPTHYACRYKKHMPTGITILTHFVFVKQKSRTRCISSQQCPPFRYEYETPPARTAQTTQQWTADAGGLAGMRRHNEHRRRSSRPLNSSSVSGAMRLPKISSRCRSAAGNLASLAKTAVPVYFYTRESPASHPSRGSEGRCSSPEVRVTFLCSDVSVPAAQGDVRAYGRQSAA